RAASWQAIIAATHAAIWIGPGRWTLSVGLPRSAGTSLGRSVQRRAVPPGWPASRDTYGVDPQALGERAGINARLMHHGSDCAVQRSRRASTASRRLLSRQPVISREPPLVSSQTWPEEGKA